MISLPRRIALPAALGLATAVVYGAAALSQTGGEWTAPLDDAYIYYQYAKSFAGGHPFSYVPGDPPTSGATSLLHLALLVPWFAAGVRGAAAVAVTFAGGAAALAASLWLVRDLLERRIGQEVALWGVLLYAASGPLAWGYLSGMELPLVHLLLVASCHALLTPAPPWRRAALLCGLALARPEGWLFAIALLVARAALGAGTLRDASDASSAPELPCTRSLAAPVLAGAAPFLLSLLLTGRLASHSMRAKAVAYEGTTTFGELIARGGDHFAFLMKGLFGGAQADLGGALSANRGQVGLFFPPLFLAAFLIGILPDASEEASRRRAGFFLPAALWFFGGLFIESALLPYPSHWIRYAMPFFPLFLIGGALGVARVGDWLGAGRRGLAAMRGLFAFFLAYSLVGWAMFAVGFARNARDIRDQHVVAGRWIARNLSPDARVALNDAGALAYFGERRIIDLVGLVTPGTTDPCNEGPGALYEHLEALPPDRRPTHFAVYPDWIRVDDLGLVGPALFTAPLFRPSIAGSRLPLTIAAAEWSGAGRGDAPLGVPPGWRVADALDIADLASEARHRYRFARPGPGFPESEALALAYGGDGAPRLVDGGRLLAGGERFVAAVTPGTDALLVVRTDGPFVLDVRVDGRSAGAWTYNGPLGVFSEGGFPIRGELLTGPRAEIALDTPRGAGQRSYRAFYYWVCQRG